MAHLAVVRSPFAHARLIKIAVETARRAPGVLAVITADDLAGRVQPLPINRPEDAQVAQAHHPVLAAEKVRYVGQPVAGVVAESPVAAADAAELVEVDYDPLPVVGDPREGLKGNVLLHESLGDNVLVRWRRSGGDAASAFRAAAHLVRGQFHIPRLVAAPMEPRGAMATYDAGYDLLTIFLSAQDVYRPRAHLSRVLGRPEDRIRVIVPDVGGAFGSKGSLAPEAGLAGWLAMALLRPIRWIETRRENFQAAYQGRGLDADVEMAVNVEGRILAVRARLLADLGAYLLPPTPVAPVTTGMLLTGAYEIPNAEVEVVGVATNKVPTGPYRGAGRPEAAYLVERMVDLVARELGQDPLEVRRRNFIPPDRFPYRTSLGFVYDSGNYASALERARELVDYRRWREEQRRLRAEGRLVGVGVAVYVERAGSGLWESAAASVRRDGRVIVRSGSHSHGQGHETTFAQIVAGTLGVDLEAVTVEHGDSALLHDGIGTFGSRSTTIGGSALVVALGKVKDKMTRIAAHLLEAAPEEMQWSDGRVGIRGMPARMLTFQQIAAAAYDPARLPPGLEMGLTAPGYFALPGPVFPFGAYAAVVEVVRETGEVRILKLVAVDDAGRLVNPLLAEGQVIGATVQGLGQGLVEEAVYDEGGQLVTGSFMDYGLLTADQIPEMETALCETPSPFNPLGAKGIGEAGAIGTPAALANAVLDALVPLGIRQVDFPFTPEKLWRLVKNWTG
jgi:carbon-monoxide dehydrogenase large subunit